MTDADGTADHPWVLQTPSGGSTYEAYRDDDARPAGPGRRGGQDRSCATTLRCLDDLHAMLRRRGATGSRSAARTSRSPRPTAPSRPGPGRGQPRGRLVRAQEGPAGPFANYVPPVLEQLGWPRSSTTPATTACGPCRRTGLRSMAVAEPAGDPFEALGDHHRRAIVELLAQGGRSVGEVADALPISRPAVSRHLRLLEGGRARGGGAPGHPADLPPPRRGRGRRGAVPRPRCGATPPPASG